jgi:uncharacterized protein (TIGR02266 family)
MARSTDDDARAEGRVQAAFRVHYQSIDQLVVALTNDLSRGGLFMCTARFLPINAVVRVHLELPEGGGELAVLCRVAFVRGEAEAERTGKPAGMGVEFLDFDPARIAELERFVAAHRSEPATGPTTEPTKVARRRGLDIVVADDDPALREPIAAALRGRGDRVREAADGIEALGACLNDPPDLLLSDVQMPRMDGWQLLRILRARTSLVQVPIVLLTTLTDDEARLQGYSLGVDDYIGKPIAIEELAARVDRVVERIYKTQPRDRRSLRGDLEHVALVSLLSFLAVERKTGLVLLVGETTVRIYLRGGQPLRVDIDDVPVKGADDPALAALFAWKSGRFEFTAQEIACADELHTTVNALIEQARQSTDE